MSLIKLTRSARTTFRGVFRAGTRKTFCWYIIIISLVTKVCHIIVSDSGTMKRGWELVSCCVVLLQATAHRRSMVCHNVINGGQEKVKSQNVMITVTFSPPLMRGVGVGDTDRRVSDSTVGVQDGEPGSSYYCLLYILIID